ncbi:hypothetical protein C8R43DRAFT_1016395 [Mycena crocata]|nr:hypothetical protein C8R43DRAFT_1016395 [Mycena crocata]
MSRRESRVSMNVRQNDALLEFENFKKKFLLANKHITKLNSTLSMKIEELNTEITTLYTENLRLRASEIALAAQLKREREKSRKILSDAEAATHALSSHFALLRATFNIPLHSPPSPAPTPPRRPTSSPRNSTYANNVNVNRLSREPQVPDINEDEEPEESQTPPRKSKKKRLSASRLPLPSRVGTPPLPPVAPTISLPVPTHAPPPTAVHLDLAALAQTTKKRRQSGLLLDLGVVDIDALDLDDGADDVRENERERDRENERQKEKERKRRSREEGATATSKPKPKLKDVTNSNSPRARSKPYPIPDAVPAATSLPPQAESHARAFLVPAPPSPPPPEPKALPPIQAPTAPQPQPQPVSSGSASSLESMSRACEPEGSAAESEAGGRERRTRKSVNYAEPKLNTKMRKPEPPAESAPAPVKRSRSSAAAAIPVQTRRPSPPISYSHARPEEDVNVNMDLEDEDDMEEDESDAWADGEYVPGWASGHVNVEGRRRAPHGGRRRGEVNAVVGEWAREREREGRRHSTAI